MTPPAISKTRDEFLLYAAMMLVLGSVYGGALVASPELRDLEWFIPFTSLMIFHAGLHLMVPRLWPRHFWLPPYFVVQAILAYVLIRTAGVTGGTISLYLYLALAAQAIGLLSNRPPLAVSVVAGWLIAAVITFIWLWGWASFPSFLVLAIPQTLFTLAFAVLFFRQANERRHAQTLLRELELAHHQLSEYAGQIEDLTLSNERQRMARELHDTLAQGLAGLILQLEAIDKQLALGRLERGQEIVTQAMSRARTTLADVRRAIDDLRSVDIQVSKLGKAVRDEAGRFTNATGVPCSVDADGTELEDIVLSDRLHDDALRVIAEGLTNVARHAHATQARVSLAMTHDTLSIRVMDNGLGFDPQAVNERSGHYGLIGMRERARLAGGSLDVTSTHGQGTTLVLRLPVCDTNTERMNV